MHILLLYIARTSSSYIWQIFKSFKEVHVYGEILNQPQKYLTALKASEKLGIPKEEYENFAKKNLDKYIDFLSQESTQKNFFTKISLLHVFSLLKKKSPILQKIIQDPNTKILILQRDLIDTYVSLKKVGITKAWRNQDTTDLKITINPLDFSQYLSKMTMLYSNLYEILGNKPHILIKYDDLHSLIKITNEETNQHLQKCFYLQQRLSQELDLHLTFDSSKFSQIPFMPQQDRNTNHQQKIENYCEFKEWLSEHHILTSPFHSLK